MLEMIPVELLLTCIAGSGTICGGLLVFYLNPTSNTAFGGLEAACSGIMVVISTQLIIEGLQVLDFIVFLFYFSIGFASLFLLNKLIPSSQARTLEDGIEKKDDDIPLEQEKDLLISSSERLLQEEYSRVGFTCFISMFFHNLPEGISVALSARKELSLGVELAIAIFFHNILEGMVVSLPIWFSTKSQSQVLFWTFLNGAAEPIGVLLCWLFSYMIPFTINLFIPKVLIAVSGLMFSLSLVELLPHSMKLTLGYGRSLFYFSLGFVGGACLLFSTKWVLQSQ